MAFAVCSVIPFMFTPALISSCRRSCMPLAWVQRKAALELSLLLWPTTIEPSPLTP
jgi:hypothetical protein